MKTRFMKRRTRRNKRRRIVPMRNVYADAIRCYATYIMVLILIALGSAVALQAENDKPDKVINSDIILNTNELDSVDNLQNADIVKLSVPIVSTGHDMMTVTDSILLQEKSLIDPIAGIEVVNAESEDTTENSDVVDETEIVTEEEIIEESTEEKIEIVEEEVIDYYHDTYTEDSSVKNLSGLIATQIDGLLEGTELYGIGEAVYEIEQEYSIDAYFTISVASLESGFGSSELAHSKNNIFGMRNCSFDSYSASVRYFGKLMHSYEYDHDITMTPEGINPRYCELDSWHGKVVKLMNQYVREANNLY